MASWINLQRHVRYYQPSQFGMTAKTSLSTEVISLIVLSLVSFGRSALYVTSPTLCSLSVLDLLSSVIPWALLSLGWFK